MPKWLTNLSLFVWNPPKRQVWEPKVPNALGLGIQANISLGSPGDVEGVSLESDSRSSVPLAPKPFDPNPFIDSILGNSAQLPEVDMNLSKILTAFHVAGAIVGPLVSFADTVAPNSKGVQKLDAVVNGVKNIVATGSDVVTLAEEEWAVIKPAISSLVSAFADVKHALEAPKAGGVATPVAG